MRWNVFNIRRQVNTSSLTLAFWLYYKNWRRFCPLFNRRALINIFVIFFRIKSSFIDIFDTIYQVRCLVSFVLFCWFDSLIWHALTILLFILSHSNFLTRCCLRSGHLVIQIVIDIPVIGTNLHTILFMSARLPLVTFFIILKSDIFCWITLQIIYCSLLH